MCTIWTADMQNVLSKDTTLQLPTLSGAFHSETCNANGGESDEYTEALQKVCAVCTKNKWPVPRAIPNVHPPGHRFLFQNF